MTAKYTILYFCGYNSATSSKFVELSTTEKVKVDHIHYGHDRPSNLQETCRAHQPLSCTVVLRTNHDGYSADISAKFWTTRCQPSKSVSGPTALSARNLLKITIISTASPDLTTDRHSPHRGLRAPLVVQGRSQESG